MKVSKITKIITALVMIATIALAINMVFAADVPIPTIKSDAVSSTSGLSDTVGNILGVISYICYAAAVVMLLVLGVKYITASPEGKADIKKTAVQYVIGAVLVFAAATVLQIIKSLSTSTVVNAK